MRKETKVSDRVFAALFVILTVVTFVLPFAFIGFVVWLIVNYIIPTIK